MALDLFIFGIRKLREEEIAELTGKTIDEIAESKFFRKFYPSAGGNSGYTYYEKADDSLRSVFHMLTPVAAAEEELYIFWTEKLAHFWSNYPEEAAVINEIFDKARDYYVRGQDFTVVPCGLIRQYLTRNKPACEEDEIFALFFI